MEKGPVADLWVIRTSLKIKLTKYLLIRPELARKSCQAGKEFGHDPEFKMVNEEELYILTYQEARSRKAELLHTLLLLVHISSFKTRVNLERYI